jgi:hypothetical protein
MSLPKTSSSPLRLRPGRPSFEELAPPIPTQRDGENPPIGTLPSGPVCLIVALFVYGHDLQAL